MVCVVMVGRDTMQTMDKVYFMLEKVDEAFISNALEGVIIWSCSITSYGMGHENLNYYYVEIRLHINS
jgi:hypothetical protein